jgi:peptide/nickel transport system permease protein
MTSRYLAKRLALIVPTLWGVITIVFLLIHLVPGDPVETMLGETASAGDKESLRKELGLDRPLWTQYRLFLSSLAKGDMGRSLYDQRPVAELIFDRLPATAELTIGAMVIALLFSLPAGIAAAVKKGSWLDKFSLLASLFGLVMPNFWLGPLLMIVFSIELGWLPVAGRGGVAHLLLPALTLGSGMGALLTRMIRSSLLEVARADYLQTARAKGLSEARVWLKHALRNALLPVITVMGLQFGALLAGSIITETIFSWPGIGRLTIQAIQSRDYPLVQGCVLLIALSYCAVNLITDLLYRVVDPRISYET